ncbi:hypothetical protein Emag_000081 [Eimeria magna]
MACDLGVFGMAVMGLNIALNAASRGFKVCVSNRTTSKVDYALEVAEKQNLRENMMGVKDVKEFVDNIKKPRRIIMLVQAGPPVDALINSLLPHLSKGDVLVDGGNEFYLTTEKRIELCRERGILYLGMGVSGGEEGARHGPSLMPGGDQEAWEAMRPILLSIAAQVYSVLRHLYQMNNDELCDLFAKWNKTELESYLIEITSQVLRKKEGEKYLLDLVLDAAGNKGTGKWTVQQAAEWGVPVPCLGAALDMRYISAHRGLRERLSELYSSAFEKQKKECQSEEKPTLGLIHAAASAAATAAVNAFVIDFQAAFECVYVKE